MKKSFLTIGCASFLIAPTVFVASCSSPSEQIDFKTQYDLFTPNLVKQENVARNLAWSIDDDLIGNIYSIPTLVPGIDYKFSFMASQDGKSLTLSVQLYDYKGVPIVYSETSTKKEITTINGFRELTTSEQVDINQQYLNFSNLVLSGSATELPSEIRGFTNVTGSTNYTQDNSKYKYNFELLPNDEMGELSIKLSLTSLNDYPLNANLETNTNTQIVKLFMTTQQRQTEIDSLYTGDNEIPDTINLADTIYSTIPNRYASSISNFSEFSVFYQELGKANPEIKVPPYLMNPDQSKYSPNIEINSSNSNRNLTVTINFYDNSGNILIPSTNIKKTKSISNFLEPSDEMMKATMEAYNFYYSNYQAKVSEKLTLPSGIILAQNPDGTIASTELARISEIDPLYTEEFEVTVKNYSNPEITDTFQFKPNFTIVEQNDNEGFMKFSVYLEVNIAEEGAIDPVWQKIKPSLSVSENDEKPLFSETKNEIFFSVAGFLTTEFSEANALYGELDNKINALPNLPSIIDQKFLIKTITSVNDFEKADFETLWSNLFETITPELGEPYNQDPLGIPMNNSYIINYEFFKKSDNDGYKIFSSVIDNTLYKWVKIKASVRSPSSDYEYEFLSNDKPLHNFEFNFAIKIE